MFRLIALPSTEVWHESVSGSRSTPPIGVCSSIMSEKSQKFTHPDLLTMIVLASVSALNLPGAAFSCPVFVSYHKNHQIPRSAPTLRSKGLYIPNPAPFSTLLQFLKLSCPLKFMIHQNCLSTFFPSPPPPLACPPRHFRGHPLLRTFSERTGCLCDPRASDPPPMSLWRARPPLGQP